MAALESAMATLHDGTDPTDGERAFFWDAAFQSLEASVKGRNTEKRVKRWLLSWLAERVPFLRLDLPSLRRDFNRRLNRWRAGGRQAAALQDRRPDANVGRRIEIPMRDRDRIIGTALMGHDGHLAPAVRQLRDAGQLSLGLTDRNTDTPSDKSYVPLPIRRACGPEIRSMQAIRRGPRQARLNGAFIERDWSTVAAGDQFTSDDFTLEVYFWIEDLDGRPILTRGQWLPIVDCRSKRILDDLLIPERSYTGLHIRTLINHSAEIVGLPRQGYLFENGIWRRAALVGGRPASRWGDFCTTFSDRTGVEIRHTLPGNARAKIVENVGRVFQAGLRDLPGWVGPNEQVLKIEEVQAAKRDVDSGRKHPADAGFLSFEEYRKVLDSKIEAYNAAPQSSRVIGGAAPVSMSPDEAWRSLQAVDASGSVVGLVRFSDIPECRWIVATHQVRRQVGRNGISFTLGGERYTYRSDGLALMLGTEVETYFDPELPDSMTAITDAGQVITLPRIKPISAIASEEAVSEAQAELARFNRAIRARFGEVRHAYLPPARPNLVDRRSVEIGRQMAAQRNRIETARAETERTVTRANRLARELRMPLRPGAAANPETVAGLADLRAALAAVVEDTGPSQEV